MTEAEEDIVGFVAVCATGHPLWRTPAFPVFFEAAVQASIHDEEFHAAQKTAVVLPAVYPTALLEAHLSEVGIPVQHWHAVCLSGHSYWQSFPSRDTFSLAALDGNSHDLAAHGGRHTAFILPSPF